MVFNFCIMSQVISCRLFGRSPAFYSCCIELVSCKSATGVFSEWAFNSIYVVLVVILPTLVSVACKFDNFKSLPLAWRSSCPHISGFTFGVINRSQFAGRRYFPHLSLRFELSSLLSHLKFMIFASLSETLGSVFSVSDRDCAILSSKDRLHQRHRCTRCCHCHCLQFSVAC